MDKKNIMIDGKVGITKEILEEIKTRLDMLFVGGGLTIETSRISSNDHIDIIGRYLSNILKSNIEISWNYVGYTIMIVMKDKK